MILNLCEMNLSLEYEYFFLLFGSDILHLLGTWGTKGNIWKTKYLSSSVGNMCKQINLGTSCFVPVQAYWTGTSTSTWTSSTR